MGALCEGANRQAQHMTEVQEFIDLHPDLEAVVDAIEDMTEDTRAALFGLYCRECASPDPHCQCWNDE